LEHVQIHDTFHARGTVVPNTANASAPAFEIKIVVKLFLKHPVYETELASQEGPCNMDLQEVRGVCGDWMELAQDRDGCRALVSTVKNLRVP
jgi:hypothetical protein